jgi:cardiolipin synthase
MKFIGAGARPGQPLVHRDAVFTVPNILTVVRFLGVPLFIWLVLSEHKYGYGALVLAVMASTDWVDGYIARRFNQMSNLGRVMDPIADRLSLIAVAVTLVIAGVVEWWYLVALLVPDAVLLALSLFYFHGHPDLPVSRIGKIRTGLLLVGTPLLVLSKLQVPAADVYATVAWIFLGLGLLGHWIAAYNYVGAIIAKGRQLRAHDGGSH